MNFEPMLAEPGTIVLAVFAMVILFFLAVILSVICAIIILVKRSNAKSIPGSDLKTAPLKPVPEKPVSPASVPLSAEQAAALTKTQVMARKCPQCGAALPADAPEGLCPACLLQRGFATEGGAAGGQSNFVPPGIDELAKLFPQLEILACLGRGGMGAVYKARQRTLDRLVALKILAPEKQNDPQFAERFEREARVLARLSHPNIVSVYDFGEVQGRFYLLMEFVDGLTLRQVMQTEKISPEQALELVPKICEALQYAHGQGIVHRDIKPENILLDKQGRLKIADFGIAKIAGVEAKGLSLTGARDVMGTPVYMAPEQVEKPQSVDHRADIYSLGVVFYEMLTGELPLGKFAPPSKKVQVDVRLDEVVLHALEKEPARRYQEAQQVKTAVETIAGSPPPIGAVSGSVAAAAAAMDGSISDKIILPAFLLAFFFGPFGAHRFYAGKYGTAVLQLFTCGGLGIWATIDWILLACGVFTDANGRRMKNWVHPGPSLPRPVVQNAQTNISQGIAGIAPQKDLFWRRFAIVITCVILIFAVLAVAAVALVKVALATHARADAPAYKQLTPEELKAAGIYEENGQYWKTNSQTFPLNANGRFSIDNIKGKIEIEGWSSNLVVLDSKIHARTGESVNVVKVNIDSDPDHVTVNTEQPANNTGLWDLILGHNAWRETATTDYIVKVPHGAKLGDVSTVNGSIDVSEVAGSINASTVNGGMNVRNAAGNLKLSTVNGTGTVSMDKLAAGQSVTLDAVNGEFNLQIPEDSDAQVTVTTINGDISSQFPDLQPKKEFPVGNNLKGKLGNGGAKVKVNAVNGRVKFLKGKTAARTVFDDAVVETNALAATVVAIATNTQNTAEAISAAKDWLAVIDAGDYAKSWRQTADIFQKGVTQAAWEDSMNTYRKPLGTVKSRQLATSQTTTQMPGAPDGQYVVMVFQTSFTGKASAVETVTFNLEKDGTWKSSGYFIR